ncbi:MAG: hypothetical protein AB7P17_00860 [Nitrospirales bacterium]|nr:hypothetical protein [Nitrospirales bacterium]
MNKFISSCLVVQQVDQTIPQKGYLSEMLTWARFAAQRLYVQYDTDIHHSS